MTRDVIWHDVECASYTADVDAWLELASRRAGPILDIGCGSGRIALPLAGRGHEVTALDVDPALVAALGERARTSGLHVDAVVADARGFALARRFALAIAPMQVAQLLGGAEGRRRMLRNVRRHLLPGGVLAVALADPFEAVAPSEARPPLPDVREEDGWVYSSTPIAVHPDRGATTIERLRQAVSPAGELEESFMTVRLDDVTPAELEREGAACGFGIGRRLEVPATADYLGSTIVQLEAS